VLEETTRDVVLEPLDDWIVVEPLDDSETASGLIVPINEGAQTRQAIVAAVGPDVESIDPGDKVLFPATPASRSAWRARRTASVCSSARTSWPASTTDVARSGPAPADPDLRNGGGCDPPHGIELPSRGLRRPAAQSVEPDGRIVVGICRFTPSLGLS
jgi:hypothetical protein